MGLQEVMTVLRQGHGTLPPIKGDKLRQALITQMSKVRLARIARLVPRVAEITLPKSLNPTTVVR